VDELQKAVEAKLLREILEASDPDRRLWLINAYREFAHAVQAVQFVKKG